MRSTRRPHRGNKKVGDEHLPTLARWENQLTLPFFGVNIRISASNRQAQSNAPFYWTFETF
jgi:hypothetical protein